MKTDNNNANMMPFNHHTGLAGLKASKEARESSIEKAKKAYKAPAWVAAIIIPVLLMLSLFGRIGHAGLGGTVLLLILIPSSIIAIILLRFVITGPFLKTILDPKANPVLRKAVLCVGVMLLAGLVYLMWNNAFEPYPSVKKVVAEISEIEGFFTDNKENFETQRIEAGSISTFYINYPQKSDGFLQVGFVYNEDNPAKTGYLETYCYTYKLDGHWYIEIILLDAN